MAPRGRVGIGCSPSRPGRAGCSPRPSWSRWPRPAPGVPWERRGEEDFRAVWFSGTGKGGQHRNKTQRSLRLTNQPTGLVKTRQSRSRADNARDARAALDARLDALAAEAGDRLASAERRRQDGTGERSDKVRTWRFQEGQAIDHRTSRRACLQDVEAENFLGLTG